MEVSVNNLPSDLPFPEGKGVLSYPLATSYCSLLLPERLFVLWKQFTGCYLIFVPCGDFRRVLSSDKQEALPLQSGELWKPRVLICRQRLAQLVFSLREKCGIICIKGVLSKHVICKPLNLKTNNNNKKTPTTQQFSGSSKDVSELSPSWFYHGSLHLKKNKHILIFVNVFSEGKKTPENWQTVLLTDNDHAPCFLISALREKHGIRFYN